LSAHGEVEGVADDQVDFVDRLRGERPPVLAAMPEERLVEVVEVFGAQRDERHLSQPESEVSVDDPAVPVDRRRAKVSAFGRQPHL
jgi:hypothetical protein